MVDPGANSSEIREEVFEAFKSNMDSRGVDQEVRQTIVESLTGSSSPEDITDEVMATLEASDED